MLTLISIKMWWPEDLSDGYIGFCIVLDTIFETFGFLTLVALVLK